MKTIKTKGISFTAETNNHDGIYQTTIRKGKLRFDITHIEPNCPIDKLNKLKRQACAFYLNYCS